MNGQNWKTIICVYLKSNVKVILSFVKLVISCNVPKRKQTHREHAISSGPMGTCPGDQIFSAQISLLLINVEAIKLKL